MTEFYDKCRQIAESTRDEQINKGLEKYPEPFNPKSWSHKELLHHAMQENIDQQHYIIGLGMKLEKLEHVEELLIEALQHDTKEDKYYAEQALLVLNEITRGDGTNG